MEIDLYVKDRQTKVRVICKIKTFNLKMTLIMKKCAVCFSCCTVHFVT